jgi:hypothetical protein
MNNQNDEPRIDPTLIKKIELLDPTPERDPKLAAQSRDKFLNELESLPLTDSVSALGWLTGLLKSNTKAGNTMSIGKRKFAFSTIAAVLFVFVVLFGGASATAYASQSALPGDALYPVKSSLEHTQISLANDAYNRAQLHLEFAQHRLNEITELLSQGRTHDVEFASSEFEHHIQEAMQSAQIVLAADPERGAELNKLVSQSLLDYASALKFVLLNVPDVVKPAVEKALLISQDGAGEKVEVIGIVASISDTELEIDGVIYSITDLTEFDDFIQAGDSVKLHVILTADGFMVVREIELSGLFEGNSNTAEDENSNDSLDGNDNENDSGDELNENETDDHSNENDQNDNEANENSSGNGTDDSINENESDDSLNDNESNDNDSNSGSSEDDNDNRSKDNESDEDKNDNGSGNNDNESEDNENKSDDN